MQVEGQHKESSNTFLVATGARVSNAYPTCLSYWDSLSKERLIPNNILNLHELNMKAPAMRDGDAFH